VGKPKDPSRPNTRKKRRKVREAQRRDQLAAEKAARVADKALGRLSRGFDEAMEGCRDV
jgi:hypothetical protein